MSPQENEADSSAPSSSTGSNPPGTSTSPNWAALRVSNHYSRLYLLTDSDLSKVRSKVDPRLFCVWHTVQRNENYLVVGVHVLLKNRSDIFQPEQVLIILFLFIHIICSLLRNVLVKLIVSITPMLKLQYCI